MNNEITLEQFRRWLILYAQQIGAEEEHLTELDAAIGDADHGINMQRGLSRVCARLATQTGNAELDGHPNDDSKGVATAQTGDEPSSPESAEEDAAQQEFMRDIGSLLRNVAMTLISSVGGAAGPLYGAFFLWAAKSAGTQQKVTLMQLSEMLRTGLEGVQQRGKAQPGEKTMIDVLAPAIAALESAAAQHASVDEALARMVTAAETGMQHTVELQAMKGRASYLGARSIGHMDPGAASAFLLVRAAADSFGDGGKQDVERQHAESKTQAESVSVK